MAYKINHDKCMGCGSCAAACPMNCITQGENGYEIDKSVCIECGSCKNACPMEAPELDNE